MIRKIKGELRFIDDKLYYNDDAVYNVTGCESVEELKEDSANIYMVYEYVSNYSRVYVASGFSEQDAFEQCGFEPEDLQGIELIEFVQ